MYIRRKGGFSSISTVLHIDLDLSDVKNLKQEKMEEVAKLKIRACPKL